MLIDMQKDSQYQEQIIEYKFVSELMVHLAYTGRKLELMRVDTDAFGYDLILKVGDVMKYVQLKSRKRTGRAQYWDVHKSLLENEIGTVIVVLYEFAHDDLQLEYMYLDQEKYEMTRQIKPKGKKDSDKYCRVSKKDLVSVPSVAELCEAMFD